MGVLVGDDGVGVMWGCSCMARRLPNTGSDSSAALGMTVGALRVT